MNELSRGKSEPIDVQRAVETALKGVPAYPGQGVLASYIPALASVNPASSAPATLEKLVEPTGWSVFA